MTAALILEAREIIPSLIDPVALLLADKRSPGTRRAYAHDLADFFGGAPSPETVRSFLALPVPQVALRLTAYKAGLLERGLAEATVNRRLAAVRSLLKLAHRLGHAQTDGRGLVEGERVRPYRDTAGPRVETLRRLLALPDPTTLRGQRDAALLRLLWENALRRAEVCRLDVGDFARETGQLQVRGKGRGTQKEPVDLSPRCVALLAVYLEAHGHGQDPAAPLFRNVERRPAHHGGRLTPNGLYGIVQAYGKRLGLTLRPHGLRHAAITAALEATGGDVRKVQRLSRHAKLETLAVYDDNRHKHQAEVTALLSDLA